MLLIKGLFFQVFLYIIVGYLLASFFRRRLEAGLDYFTKIALYFLFPSFILITMWQNSVQVIATQKIVVVAVMVVIFGHLWALFFSYVFKKSFRQISLPLIYMNTAYLAIPVNTYLFGSLGAAASIVYSVNITLLIFSIGLYLVGDVSNKIARLKEILQLPILYAAILGIFLSWKQAPFPPFILPFAKVLQTAVLPIMLVFVGYQLKSAYQSLYWQAFWGVLFRMGGGLFVSFILVKILGLTGVEAGVCLVSSSMPPAINTYILSKRFGGDSQLAAAMIFWGIILCPLIIVLISYIR